jgi:predicted  nucleic acid-binding Zn-ribbon protein
VATAIERENLEAHVELCAERYAKLETKLESVENKVEALEDHIIAIREALAGAGERQSKQIIAIGTAIITVLIAGIITLTINFINK